MRFQFIKLRHPEFIDKGAPPLIGVLLSLLDDQNKLRWEKPFFDGSFVPAKKGDMRSARPSVVRVPR